MRATCRENLSRCWARYVTPLAQSRDDRLVVIDIGRAGDDTHPLLQDAIRLDAPSYGQQLPVDERSADVVTIVDGLDPPIDLGHVLSEAARAVRDDGVVILIAASATEAPESSGTRRFNPALAGQLTVQAGLHVVEQWQDPRGPSHDVVTVASGSELRSSPDDRSLGLATVANDADPSWDTRDNTVQGVRPYLECLAELHRVLQPDFYLEIGVRHGRSLALAQRDAIGVDPLIDLTVELPASAQLFELTSDAFFETAVDEALPGPVDFAFIDGMHLIEYVVRDFMNVERASKPTATIVIDDVLPNHPDQATRNRQTRVWCGDVWKIYPLLQRFRPDLELTILDTWPSGLLLVSNIDPDNTVLWDHYNDVLSFAENELLAPSAAITSRTDAEDPNGWSFAARVRELPSPKRPLLSVVVISYNMRRELPRTLYTLSPAVQGLDPTSYEIIVVDNGSTPRLDPAELEPIAPNIVFAEVENPTHSPVPAVNLGLGLARGDLIGVMIDGARMASPGLLRAAVSCHEQNPAAVIGTIARHLGDQVQSKAVAAGYNTAVEDELLGRTPWRTDGYSLFDVSVLASSSRGGWFATPAETNALFMHFDQWRALDGYDERFAAPGGGLVNHDTWSRAAALPNAETFLLLGEATFHQVHGGVATNAATSRWPEFVQDYETVTGKQFEVADFPVKFFGELRPGMDSMS